MKNWKKGLITSAIIVFAVLSYLGIKDYTEYDGYCAVNPKADVSPVEYCPFYQYFAQNSIINTIPILIILMIVGTGTGLLLDKK